MRRVHFCFATTFLFDVALEQAQQDGLNFRRGHFHYFHAREGFMQCRTKGRRRFYRFANTLVVLVKQLCAMGSI